MVDKIEKIKIVWNQPATRHLTVSALGFDIAWAGLVYRFIDALFLNVMPVVTVWGGTSQFGWTESILGKMVWLYWDCLPAS